MTLDNNEDVWCSGLVETSETSLHSGWTVSSTAYACPGKVIVRVCGTAVGKFGQRVWSRTSTISAIVFPVASAVLCNVYSIKIIDLNFKLIKNVDGFAEIGTYSMTTQTGSLPESNFVDFSIFFHPGA